MNEKFGKIKKMLTKNGMVGKLSPAYERQLDKSPDQTLVKDPKLKYAKKLVKI